MNVMCAHDKLMSIAELRKKFHPKNHNIHPADQIERLAKLLEYQGVRKPATISKRSGFITAGHGRILAAEHLGWKKYPVDLQDYDSEEQEYADLTADNAIGAWSDLDLSAINMDLPEMGPDFDLDMLGIKDFVLEPADKEPGSDGDHVPGAVNPICQLGNRWLLGEHVLVCGDSTDSYAIDLLMMDEKADLWLTDPPYGVSYKSNGAEDKHREIANDSMPLEEMKIFWTKCAASALSATTNKAAYYWFACQGGDQMMMMMALGDGGWQVKHELIWLKDRLVLGRCDYHYKHEPILYGWKRKGTHEWYGDRKQTSILECQKPRSSDLHPTMKPIELLEPLINNSTKSGEKVLDLFGGSGSTLIACEKLHRKAYLMEIDPHYCDVIIARWEAYTSKKAQLAAP